MYATVISYWSVRCLPLGTGETDLTKNCRFWSMAHALYLKPRATAFRTVRPVTPVSHSSIRLIGNILTCTIDIPSAIVLAQPTAYLRCLFSLCHCLHVLYLSQWLIPIIYFLFFMLPSSECSPPLSTRWALLISGSLINSIVWLWSSWTWSLWSASTALNWNGKTKRDSSPEVKQSCHVVFNPRRWKGMARLH